MNKVITIEENNERLFEKRMEWARCHDYKILSTNCGIVDGKTVYVAILERRY
jgi:hypothetical protein